jgi:hypothetical protein
MNTRGIHVEARKGGRETVVRVDGWPRRRGVSLRWRISTQDAEGGSPRGGRGRRRGRKIALRRSKGRILVVAGWHRFEQEVAVGWADIHVPSSQGESVTVTQVDLRDTLVEKDRRDVLIELLACSGEIAAELQQRLGLGDGCLDWRVPAADAGRLGKLFPDFSIKDAKTRRGRQLLRKC